MTKTIHKAKIPLSGTRLLLPRGADILKIGMQDETICVWYLFMTGELETEIRDFFIVGTGQEMSLSARYHGTVFIGPYVWHVWEKGYDAGRP